MTIKESWKGEREFWDGRRLTESSPERRRWVSHEQWKETPAESDGLAHFIKEDDIKIPYSVFDRAISTLKQDRSLKRLGSGGIFFNEVYILGCVVLTYTNQHTFRERCALAITLESSEMQAIERTAEALGL